MCVLFVLLDSYNIAMTLGTGRDNIVIAIFRSHNAGWSGTKRRYIHRRP